MSTLGGKKIQAVELHWPTWGSWWARVATEAGTVPDGLTTLTIGDLSLVGTVLPERNGEGAPSSWSAIVMGAAAWDTVLPARAAYQSDDGVRLKTVLADLARECGGALMAQPKDAALGPFWARPRLGPGGRPWTGRDELAALVRVGALGGWWPDIAGVTRFGARPGGVVLAKTREQPGTPTRGLRMVGVDAPAAFAPGKSWQGRTIGRTVIRDTSGGAIRVELWDA